MVRQRAKAGRVVNRLTVAKTKLAVIEAIERRILLSISLVTDTNLVNEGAAPSNIVPLGGSTYFTALRPRTVSTDAAVTAIWKTDGTEVGTVPIATVSSPQSLTAVGNVLYYADQAASQWQIWKFDPVTGTTAQVGTLSGVTSVPRNLTPVGSSLFFTAINAAAGDELYVTDGIATTIVADLRSGSAGSAPSNLTAFNGSLLFSADAGTGRELWKTDGTAAGTALVADLNVSAGSNPESLVAVGSAVYFSADDGTTGRELWKTDGTASGTAQVSDIVGGAVGSFPEALAAMGNTLYFAANTPAAGRELWKSDGTAAGTVMVADIAPGVSGSGLVNISSMGGLAYFTASDGTTGTELWKSDGTTAGTQRVADIIPGANSSWPTRVVPIAGGIGVFMASTSSGTELWRTDGSAAGTFALGDLRPGAASPSILHLSSDGTAAFFSADNGVDGPELYRTDGTLAGTGMVRNAVTFTLTNQFSFTFTAGGITYFNRRPAPFNSAPTALWRTDGTVAGTFKIADNAVVNTANNPSDGVSLYPRWADLNGLFVFHNESDGEVWRSDGTAAGTYRIREINSSTIDNGSSSSSAFVSINGVAYFSANDAQRGHELWRTDGTPAGTYLVKDIAPGGITSHSNPRNLTDVNGTLYFTQGGRLWKSDGTTGGTVVVRDFLNGDAIHLTSFNGTLLFAATEGAGSSDYELWRSDGTNAGTFRVVDLMPGLAGTLARGWPVAVAGNYVTFGGWSPGGIGLYRSDGTASGTVLLKTVATVSPGGSVVGPRDTRVAGGLTYFTMRGTELWRSDGTTAGTFILRTFINGTNAEVLLGRAVGDTLYFMGNDGISGQEIWKTDGTVASTALAQDIFPGATSSSPGNWVLNDGRLIFTATDPLRGMELWKVEDAVATPNAPESLTATPIGGGRIALTWLDQSTNETHFQLERSTSATFTVIERSVRVAANATGFIDDVGVVPGATYHYRLRAIGGAAASPAVSTSAVALAVPAMPTGLTATAVSANIVNLAWTDAAANETAYRVDRSLHPTFALVDASFPLAAGTTTFADSTAVGLTRYYYRVVAVNAEGDSAPAVANARTGDGPPVLEAWGVSSSEINLQWTDNSSTEFYFSVRRGSSAAGPFSEIGTVTSNKTSFVDPGREDGRPYYYKIVAILTDGPVAESNVATATTVPQQPSQLVKDLHAATLPGYGSSPAGQVVMNGIAYFAAADSTTGRELWRSDGTAAGTWRVADLSPGPSASDPQGLVAVNGTLYFTATDRDSGRELWKSDGTAAGTSLVSDLVPGPGSSGLGSMTASGGKLYFVSASGNNGNELWVSDGTSAGTRVLDMVPGPGGLSPLQLTEFNGVLYFSGTTQAEGRELWRSDGTEAGTYRVSDINAGLYASSPTHLVVMGNRLYFSAVREIEGRELWSTDGTTGGTTYVADLATGVDSSNPSNLTVSGSTLYFTATLPGTGRELWKSDGSAAGTVLVKDVTTGGDTVFESFASTNAGVAFTVVGAGSQRALWHSDGTAAGTVQLYQGNPGQTYSTELVTAGNNTYFLRSTGAAWQLWKTDGTPTGTVLVNGSFATAPTGLTKFGGSVLLSADDGTTGRELWVSDGTPAGTQVVADINSSTRGSNPDNLVVFKGQVYFTTGNEDGFAPGLWRTDGTADGTVLIRDTLCFRLTVAGDYLYFHTSDPATGSELWKTDGTALGTSIVADITPGAGSTGLWKLVAAGSRLFFTVDLPNNSLYELWSTDGFTTAKATETLVQVEDSSLIRGGPVAIGNTVYFAGWVSPTHGAGVELWKSDGTPAGTTLVTDLFQGQGDSGPRNLTAVNNTLFFTAYTPDVATGLWRSDGTAAGTVLVKDIYDGVNSPPVANLTASGNYLYFAADDPVYGYEPWRTDGTPAGTTLVADTSVTTGRIASNFTRVGTTTYFVSGDRLWKMDDAAAAATPVREIYPDSSYPFGMWGANQTLFYFNRGYLWKSDGSAAGTVQITQVHKINSGNPAPQGSPVALLGDTFFFSGYEPVYGRELRRVAASAPAAPSELAAAPGPASIRLQWDDNATNEAGFLIERSDDSAFNSLDRSFFVPADSSTFVDATAAAGTTWHYRMQAVNATGNSAFSNSATGAVGATPLPVIASPDVHTVTEQGQAALALPAGLPAGSVYQWDFDFDGFTFDVSTTGAMPVFSAAGIDGPRTRVVAVRSVDVSGNPSSIWTARVSITNAAPTAVFSATGAVSGEPVVASFTSATDASPADAAGLRYAFDFNNDGDFTDAGDVFSSTFPTASFAFANPGSFTIRGRVFDNDGGHNDYTTTVAVTATTIPSGQTYVVAEGGQVQLGAPSGMLPTPITYEWDLDFDGVTFDPTTTGTTAVFSAVGLDGPTQRVIAVRATGSGGQTSNILTATVSVTNVSPTAAFVAAPSVTLGQPSTATFASAIDASAADQASLRYSVDFNNDGDFTDAGDVLDSASATATFTFASAGTFTVRGRVSDDDGGFTDYTATTVVNPPLPPPPVTPNPVDSTRDVRAAADAYAADGTNAAKNFGSALDLQVRKSATAGSNRESFFRFDLGSGPAYSSLESAKLRIFARATAAGSVTLDLYAVAGTSWAETGVTWNARPASGTKLASKVVSSTTAQWLEFDVSAYVKQQKAAGATKVAFALRSPIATTAAISFPSDEAAANRPTLRLGERVTPAVVWSASSIPVREAGTATATVRLTVAPTGPVTVTVTRASGDADLSAPTSVTFTPTDWATPKTVTFAALADADSTNGSAVFTASAPGFGTKSIIATETDDDLPKTLRANADSFVRDGTYAAVNNGTNVALHVRKSTTAGATRWSLLKFDLTTITSISNATLRLFGRLDVTTNPSVRVQVFAASNTTWTEAGVTWNNKPAVSGASLGEVSVAGTTAKWYTLSLTAWLKAQKEAGRTSVALVLQSPVATTSMAAFNSDESAGSRPELVVTP